MKWSSAVMATSIQALTSAVMYVYLVWWHYQLIPWKNPETDQSYAAYGLYR